MTSGFSSNELLKSLSRYSVSKGDVPGHEFHGNQYTGGEGGGNSDVKKQPGSGPRGTFGEGIGTPVEPFHTTAEQALINGDYEKAAEQYTKVADQIEGAIRQVQSRMAIGNNDRLNYERGKSVLDACHEASLAASRAATEAKSAAEMAEHGTPSDTKEAFFYAGIARQAIDYANTKLHLDGYVG
jgi:hypothetical protein